MRRLPAIRRSAAGFTLIEAVMVMVITGILAAIVAVFINKPVEGYVDAVRRAELTDAADVALRRLARDIHLALPNSLRVTESGGVHYIEFIITSTGGRYRDAGDGSTGGDVLSFSSTLDVTFDVLGAMPSNPSIAANDWIVVYNLGPGYAPANAYNCTGTCNRAQVSSISGNTITLGSNPFAAQSPPLPSPGSRFQVVPNGTRAVTYACPSTMAGNLTRYWNYGFNPSQTTTLPPGGNSAILAAGATCSVEFTTNATGRNGLLYVSLRLSSGGESATLFQQIHVDGTP